MNQDTITSSSKTFLELLELYSANKNGKKSIKLLRHATFANEKNVSPQSIESYIKQLSKKVGANRAISIFHTIEKIYDNGISHGIYNDHNPCHQIRDIRKVAGYKQSLALSFTTCILAIISILSLISFAVSKFIIDEFGNVNIDQVLLHIRMAEGIDLIDAAMIQRALKYCSKALLATILLIGSMHVMLNHTTQKTKFKRSYLIKNILCWISLVFISSVTLLQANKLLPFAQWLRQKTSHFIENNYYQLDTSHATFNNNQKRNLIMIVLESIEDGFKDHNIYDKNLIPELISLQSQGIYFYGYKKTQGSFCTIDGLAAQMTGVPLVHANSLWRLQTKYNNLLANTPSIFNLLNNLGYKTAWFSGASGKFTAKHNFFASHGMQACYDKEYWENLGHPLNEQTIGVASTVYNDDFLFSRLREWLNNDNNTNDQFAILFETGDTHQPNGFAAQIHTHFGDHRDSIHAASIMTSNFIQWAQQQPWYKNTTIVIVGDHPWMDAKNHFTENFTKRSENREIFNLIINSTIGTDGQCFNIAGGFSPMDLAPTYLNAMGIHFTSHNKKFGTSNSRLGLGQSLFCQEPTIISQLGHEKFVDELKTKSKFYRELF